MGSKNLKNNIVSKNTFILKILKNKFEGIKKRNPRYSIRGLAKELEISSGSLTDFLNEKRIFSLKILHKLVTKLNLNEKELKYFDELPLVATKSISNDQVSVQFSLSEEGRKKSRKARADFVNKLSKLESTHKGSKREKIVITEEN